MINDEKFASILSDRHSGSYTISYKALEYYQHLIEKAGSEKTAADGLYEILRDASKTLIKQQPNMALLRWVGTNLLTFFKHLLKSDKEDAEIISTLQEKAKQIKATLENNTQKIAQMGSKVIATSNKVMTISSSTAVKEILLTAEKQKRRFEVFNLLSFPPSEGSRFAELLGRNGIKTTVIADSQMGVFLEDMNLVMVGADRIIEHGFINKAGTLPLCLTAKHYNIPVYLAAETLKILPEKERSIKKRKEDPREIYIPENKLVHVDNEYYETIPLDLIYKVICEDGVFETFEFINWYLKEA